MASNVVEGFREYARVHPQALAIIEGNRRYDYGQAAQYSQYLAGYLVSHGQSTGQVVGILMPRTALAAVAMLGVVQSGAAYLILDPLYPAERLLVMLRDAAVSWLIVDSALAHLVSDYECPKLPSSQLLELPVSANPDIKCDSDTLFTLLYTSGTTGMPKGVRMLHGNVASFCQHYRDIVGFKAGDVHAGFASLGFDMGMQEVFAPLSCGGTLCLVPEEIRLDLASVADYYQSHGVTHACLTTQLARCFAQNLRCPTLRFLVGGGEKLVGFQPVFDYQFINAYGPTESTAFILYHFVNEYEQDVPIGKPVAEQRIYLVDENNRPVATGQIGQLCVSGNQVCGGYLNRPEATHLAFVPNPFWQANDGPDHRYMYKTGDLAYLGQDGNYYVKGRIDRQVKIRGFRVELAEVEAIVRQYPQVQDASVAAFDSPGGGQHLVAFVVSAQTLDCQGLKQFVAAEKPSYMVPDSVYQIEKIPVNVHGKVDVAALASQFGTACSGRPAANSRPSSGLAGQIAECLAAVLGHSDFSSDSDFFELGLTSIGVAQLTAALGKVGKRVVRGSDLYEHPTIASLAEIWPSLPSSEREAQIGLRDWYPLTPAQLAVYLDAVKAPESTSYNVSLLLELGRSVDLERMQQALQQAVKAHPALNAYVGMKHSEPCQFSNCQTDFEVSICRLSAAEFAVRRQSLVTPFEFMPAGASFDPKYALARIRLFATEDNNYLFIDFHHLISDGASMEVFVRDAERAYRGDELKPESFTAFDWALERCQLHEGPAYQEALAAYRLMLSGANMDMRLPAEPHLADRSSACYVKYDSELRQANVDGFCQEIGVSANTFFCAAFAILLANVKASDTAVFGCVYNGRGDSRCADICGYLVNSYPLCLRPGRYQDIASFMQASGRQIRSCMQHDIFSFSDASRHFGVKCDLLFVYQGQDILHFTLAGQSIHSEPLPVDASIPLVCEIFVADGGYRFDFTFRQDCYNRAQIEGLAQSFDEVAKSCLTVDRLAEVNLLSDSSRAWLERVNQTQEPCNFEPLGEWLERLANQHPERLAVVCEQRTLTYQQLNNQANRLAHGLIAVGVKPGQLVGLMMPRTELAYVGREGIIKAGAAFLALGCDYPQDRLEYILSDSQCQVIVVDESLAQQVKAYSNLSAKAYTLQQLGQNENTRCPEVTVDEHTLAYCLYTSGSTGRPKGVMLEQRGLVNYCLPNSRHMHARSYVEAGQAALAITALTFDVSVLEHFLPLRNGMTVCLATSQQVHDPRALAQFMLSNKVNVATGTPSMWGTSLDSKLMQKAVKQLSCLNLGGEVFPQALLATIKRLNPKLRVFNCYGPTEATISVTCTEMTGQDVMLGTAMSNTRLYVVNRYLQVLPPGMQGELLICGMGVARGYVGLPEQNASRFVDVGYGRGYLTGDLVRWRWDGNLDYCGRLDGQVKLRGLRVELGEIEHRLLTYPGVSRACVVVRCINKVEHLAAYYCASLDIDSSLLREHLAVTLSSYLIPTAYTQLETMPLTSNGKIDAASLPEPHLVEQELYEAPATSLEAQLCNIFAAILGLSQVGRNHSFFALGGSSLQATKLVLEAAKQGLALTYAQVFDYPTPKLLAQSLKETQATTEADSSEDDIRDYNYGPIEKILAVNNLAAWNGQRRDLGNILLTGATGFLGIHILRELLEQHSGKIYCFMRKGRQRSLEVRLKALLVYYFSNDYAQASSSRLVLVEGDVQNLADFEALIGEPIDTVINCAANVKHFASDSQIEDVNVGGVKNVCSFCQRKSARLIHISTTSVAGLSVEGVPSPERRFSEQMLYIGQNLSNKYLLSKFKAERLVLQAIAAGLDGKIIRAGNLMGRHQDGEFQINLHTNSFVNRLRAYYTLGRVPYGDMSGQVELSAIDSTARAILLLAQTPRECCLFHAYNNHHINIGDMISVMNSCNLPVQASEEADYAQAFGRVAQNDELAERLASLVAYQTGSKLVVEMPVENEYTVQMLYRLGFNWPLVGELYVDKLIESLNSLGFFE